MQYCNTGLYGNIDSWMGRGHWAVGTGLQAAFSVLSPMAGTQAGNVHLPSITTSPLTFHGGVRPLRALCHVNAQSPPYVTRHFQ